MGRSGSTCRRGGEYWEPVPNCHTVSFHPDADFRLYTDSHTIQGTHRDSRPDRRGGKRVGQLERRN
jgi:hypothetical protein